MVVWVLDSHAFGEGGLLHTGNHFRGITGKNKVSREDDFDHIAQKWEKMNSNMNRIIAAAKEASHNIFLFLFPVR